MTVREIIIQKLKDLEKVANRNNLKTKFIYKKILKHLENEQTPILSATQLKNIPNVGPKTYNILIEHVNKILEEKIDNVNEIEIYSLFLKPDTINKIKTKLSTPIKRKQVDLQLNPEQPILMTPILESSSESNEEPNVKMVFARSLSSSEEIKPNKKEFIPGFRTGSYSILRALWEENGITKYKIAYLGRNFTDTDFDFNSKVSAWSSIKTLISKGLVYKESGSKNYFLTEYGTELCKKMFKDQIQKIDKDNSITLVIDSREIKSKSCRSFFQTYFEGKQIKIETRNLSVGDFIWTQNENVCNFIVERKCGSDLISSIVDGRFKEQKNRLIETGFKRIYYIIEGLTRQHMKKINEEYVYYCLTSTQNEGFTVIETRDIKETAGVLERLNEYIRSSESIEDFHIMSYSTFMDKGSKSRALTVNSILFHMFLSIKGITADRARKLSDYFKTPSQLFESVKKNKFKILLENKFLKENLISKKIFQELIEFFC